MAVDIVPAQSDELKEMLEIGNLLERMRKILKTRKDELGILQKYHPRGRVVAMLKLEVKELGIALDNLAAEWLEAQGKLCPDCQGEQWNRSQPGHACGGCGGGGTKKDYDDFWAKRIKEMNKHIQGPEPAN